MSKKLKLALIAVLLVLVAIQLFPVDRTNPPVVDDLEAPPEVERILRAACYDCHSNETRWPWYGYVAPVSWIVVRDIEQARAQFNFSRWTSVDADERRMIRRQIWEQVAGGAMPLPRYRWLHPQARLSQEQKATLRVWALSPVERGYDDPPATAAGPAHTTDGGSR